MLAHVCHRERLARARNLLLGCFAIVLSLTSTRCVNEPMPSNLDAAAQEATARLIGAQEAVLSAGDLDAYLPLLDPEFASSGRVGLRDFDPAILARRYEYYSAHGARYSTVRTEVAVREAHRQIDSSLVLVRATVLRVYHIQDPQNADTPTSSARYDVILTFTVLGDSWLLRNIDFDTTGTESEWGDETPPEVDASTVLILSKHQNYAIICA